MAEERKTYSSEEIAEIVSPDNYYQIENWCDTLTKDTFRTEYFKLEYEEASMLCTVHEAITLLRFVELQTMNSPQLHSEWLQGGIPHPTNLFNFFSDEEKGILCTLEEKIDTALERTGGCAFIRLSTRSPKDAALSTNKMRQIIKNLIEAEEPEELSEDEKDSRNMCIFTIACQKSLQVFSGKEAVSLLFTSKRTTHDIKLQRLHLGEENFAMNVIIREWHDIPTIWEFRTLVYDNEITLITHYYENCYVKEIVDREEEIIRRIQDKFEELNPLIPIGTYTIDFCVDPHSDKVWLIEVNNPPPTAGVSFLDFKKEEDRFIIENGPLTFMANRKPLEDPYFDVEPILVRYMKYLRGDLGKMEGIGKHPGIQCSHCGMDPFFGERFCCIECGGAEYDMDSPSLVSESSAEMHDPLKCNLCCFCFSERVHDPEHHFIVYIDDNTVCKSLLNQNRYESQEQATEAKAADQQEGAESQWCSLV